MLRRDYDPGYMPSTMTVETAKQNVAQYGKVERAYKTVLAPKFTEYWHTRRLTKLMQKY